MPCGAIAGMLHQGKTLTWSSALLTASWHSHTSICHTDQGPQITANLLFLVVKLKLKLFPKKGSKGPYKWTCTQTHNPNTHLHRCAWVHMCTHTHIHRSSLPVLKMSVRGLFLGHLDHCCVQILLNGWKNLQAFVWGGGAFIVAPSSALVPECRSERNESDQVGNILQWQ